MDYSSFDLTDPFVRIALAEDYAAQNELDYSDPFVKQAVDEHFESMGPSWNPVGAAGDVGRLLYDVPVQTKAAIGNLMEEDDPLANTDWKDRWIAEGEQRTQQRKDELAASGGAKDTMFPGTDFITRGDIVDTGASTGFSAVSILPSLGGAAIAATGVGAPVGVSLGMAGSGGVAYKMDKSMFTRELLQKANAEMQQTQGRDMTQEERNTYLAATDDVRSDHALWEAGPEAVGNALGMVGLGKIFSGVAGAGLKKVVTGALMNYGGELSTETVTQTGQQRAESALGLNNEQPRSWTSPGDWMKSAGEVAAPTAILSGIMGGGSAIAGKAYGAIQREAQPEIIPPPSQEQPQGWMQTAPAQEDQSLYEWAQQMQAARQYNQERNAPVDVPTTLSTMEQQPTVEQKADTAVAQAEQATTPEGFNIGEDKPNQLDKAGDILTEIRTADESRLSALEQMAGDSDMSDYANAIRRDIYARRQELQNAPAPQILNAIQTGVPLDAGRTTLPTDQGAPGVTEQPAWNLNPAPVVADRGEQGVRGSDAGDVGRVTSEVPAAMSGQGADLLTRAIQHVAETGDTSMGGMSKALDVDIDTAADLVGRVKAEQSNSDTRPPTEGSAAGPLSSEAVPVSQAGLVGPVKQANNSQQATPIRPAGDVMQAPSNLPPNVSNPEPEQQVSSDKSLDKQERAKFTQPVRIPGESARDYLERKKGWLNDAKVEEVRSQQKKAEPSKLPDHIEHRIAVIERQMNSGEVGSRWETADGEWTGARSSNPEWLKSGPLKEAGKAGIGTVIAKARRGLKLTPKQSYIWNEVQKVANKEYENDPETSWIAESERLHDQLGVEMKYPEDKPVGDLEEGDKAVILDDKGTPDIFTHKGYDDEGKAILKDGITIHADPWDMAQIAGVKKADKQQPTPPATDRTPETPGELIASGTLQKKPATGAKTNSKADLPSAGTVAEAEAVSASAPQQPQPEADNGLQGKTEEVVQKPAAFSENEQGAEVNRDGITANTPDGYVQAKKYPDGKYKLFFTGTRNEVFPGEVFASAKEARGYFQAEREKLRQVKATPATLTKPAPKESPAPVAEAPKQGGEAGGVVEHTTKRGKVIQGRIVTGITYAQAKTADPYTFKKDGGFFVREGAPAVEQGNKQETAEVANSPAEQKPSKEESNIKRLRLSAERLKQSGESKLNQDRNANTARRARMASSAEADARADIRTAETMLNIATAQEDGEAGALSGITSKAQLDELRRILTQAKYAEERKKEYGKQDNNRRATKEDIVNAQYPYPQFYNYQDLDGLIDLLGNKKGWRSKRNDLRRGGQWFKTEERIELLREALKLAGDDYRFRNVAEHLKGYDRLQRAGIKSELELREALEKLVGLSGKAPEKDRAKELERALVGQKTGIDFFPTPKAQAKSIVDRAGINPGMRVLEPSAGTGNLAEEMRAQGGEVEVAEISPSHRDVLEAKGFNIVAQDFMDMEEGGYDVIVMNPPFSNNMDIDHVRKAYELLAPGGRIVSIMGEGAFFRTGKKETEFRDWLDEVGVSEKLPAGFFTDKKELRTTGVNARVVEIDKPVSEAPDTVKKSSTSQPLPPSQRADIAAELTSAFGRLRARLLLRRIQIVPTQEEARRIIKGIEGDPQFSRRLDLGVSDRDVIKVGETPTVLVRLGAQQLPLVVSGRVLNKVTQGKHRGKLDLQGLIQVQTGIYDPIAVFKSSTADNSLVVFTEVTDSEGNRVVVPVQLGEIGGRNEVNAIKSIYGKENVDAWISRQVESGNLLYVNKGKAESSDLARWLHLHAPTKEGGAPARGQKVLDFDQSILTEDDVVNDKGVKRSESGAIQGFFANGNIYLVADGIAKGKALGVAKHEITHATRLGLRQGRPWQALMRSIESRMGEDSATGEALRAARKLVPANTPESDIWEETLAYTVENNANKNLGIVRRFLSMVKRWMLNNLGIGANTFTADDFNALAVSMLRREARGVAVDGVKQSVSTLFQPVDTNSAAFKRWFAGSVVTDDGRVGGEPLKVYHGTPKVGFDEFYTGNVGAFFTDRFDIAASYSGGYNEVELEDGEFIADDGQGVYATYLKASNPMVVDWGGKDWGAGPDGLRLDEIANRAKREGHDGLIVENVVDTGWVAPGIVEGDGLGRVFVVFNPSQIKSADANSGDFSPTDPRIQFSTATAAGASNPSSWDAPLDSKKDTFLYNAQNKFIDLFRVQDAIKTGGGTITEATDVRLAEELWHKRAAKRVDDFLINEVKPLMSELGTIAQDEKEFERFLWARHAEEANESLRKRNPTADELRVLKAEALATRDRLAQLQIVKDFLAKEKELAGAKHDVEVGTADDSLVDVVSNELDAIIQDRDVQAYVKAREVHKGLKKVQPFEGDNTWLSGMKDSEARDFMRGLPRETKAAYARLAGRWDNLIKQTRQTLVQYELEDQETVDAWEEAYNFYVPLNREDMSGGKGIGQGFSVKGSSTKGRTGSYKAVSNILANVVMQREKAIVRGEKSLISRALHGLAAANPNKDFWSIEIPPSEKAVDPVTGMVINKPDMGYKGKPNVVVNRFINAKGKIEERAVVFNDQNERALRMAEALKNLDTDQLGTILSASAAVTKWFSAMATQYNVVFGAVNLARDVQAAALNLTATPLAGKQASVLGRIPKLLPSLYRAVRAENDGTPLTTAVAQAWNEMQLEGGTTGFRDMFADSDDRAKRLRQDLLNINKNKPTKAFFALRQWVSDYNDVLENSTRLAVYMEAIEAGLTKKRAAQLAKDITLNFNRKGKVASQAGAMYAFFNAAAQGTEKLYRVLTGPAGKKIMAGGLILGASQAMLLAAAGFGDDEPPEFIRERNVIIPLGGKKYLTVPMPLGFHVIPNLARIPTEWALGGFKNTGKAITELMAVFAESFNPLGNSGLSVQSIAPTPIDPLIALSENKDWTGQPIARKDFNTLKPTPGHSRAKDTASWPSKLVARGLNALTGGNEYVPGMLSPTPDQIDFLIGQAAGGVGREAAKASQTVGAIVTGEDLPVHKVPFVGRFYGDSNDTSGTATRFYTNLKAINSLGMELEGRRESGKPVADFIKENPAVKMEKYSDKMYRNIQKLNKQKRSYLKIGNKVGVKKAETAIRKLMTEYNETFDRYDN